MKQNKLQNTILSPNMWPLAFRAESFLTDTFGNKVLYLSTGKKISNTVNSQSTYEHKDVPKSFWNDYLTPGPFCLNCRYKG